MQRGRAREKIEKLGLGKRLLNNLGLKLISVVIAVALWFLVVIADDPKERRVFANIPVTLTNVELLEKENKVYEVLDHSDSVRVTVWVPRSDLDKLRASDIEAIADMSKLTAVNTIAIEYTVNNADVNVTDISGNHDVVRLNVEEKATKWVSVQYSLEGEVAEGYLVTNVNLTLTRMEVSGPKSAIDQISYAGIKFDVTNATSNMTANVETKLYNAEGKELDFPNVTKNTDSVVMTVTVLATKEVPVEIHSTGVPAEGYLATGEMSCEPSVVKIAGRSAVLAGISKITIPEEELDITGAEETVVRNINLKEYLPTGTQLADTSYNGRVTATVYVEPVVERTLVIPEENIRVLSFPEGFEWEYDETEQPCSMIITGLNATVSQVQPEALVGTVDIEQWMEEEEIEKLKPGTYVIPVSFEVPEEVKIKEEVFIQIIVSEVKEEEL